MRWSLSWIHPVSDSAYAHQAQDTSGPLLTQILQASHQIQVVHTIVVPDDALHIRATVRQVASNVDLVLCTGGTGLGARDVTPEAVSPLLHRPTPGITQGIMSASLAKTPLGSLSRGISGIWD